jgi:hypothetical protein
MAILITSKVSVEQSVEVPKPRARWSENRGKIPGWNRNFSPVTVFGQTLRLTHFPTQWVTGFFSQGVKQPGREADTHIHLVSTLRLRGAIEKIAYILRSPIVKWYRRLGWGKRLTPVLEQHPELSVTAFQFFELHVSLRRQYATCSFILISDGNIQTFSRQTI